MTIQTCSVSEAVALLNQTLSFAYPTIRIQGELSSFKIAKEKWVYADIKDDESKLRLFGTIYQLPGPLEDGMMVEIEAEPRIHPQFGFSLNLKSIRPVGEGSIKKAADLLMKKLESEGLFAPERKRYVPSAPERIGLIASEESAGYADFIKIMNSRWGGVNVELYNVGVQGEQAIESLLEAFIHFNQASDPPDVLVMIRGGGSVDDLAVFSTEQVTRAVAGSRIPTVVAIGHEIDTSLAELAADMRASTPSNAAELMFPDKNETVDGLKRYGVLLQQSVAYQIDHASTVLSNRISQITLHTTNWIEGQSAALESKRILLEQLHPKQALKRGFALVQKDGKLIHSIKQIKKGDTLKMTLRDGSFSASVDTVE